MTIFVKQRSTESFCSRWCFLLFRPLSICFDGGEGDINDIQMDFSEKIFRDHLWTRDHGMTQVIACDITNICKKTCFQAYWLILKYFLNHRLPSICNTERRGSRWCLGHFAEMSHQGPHARTFQRNILHRCCTRHVQVKFQVKFIVHIHLTFLTFLKISNLPPTLSLTV